MAERARFEIFSKDKGQYCWQFRIDGVVECKSERSFGSSDDANDHIHIVMRAIDEAECGIHPDIVDLEDDDGN